MRIIHGLKFKSLFRTVFFPYYSPPDILWLLNYILIICIIRSNWIERLLSIFGLWSLYSFDSVSIIRCTDSVFISELVQKISEDSRVCLVAEPLSGNDVYQFTFGFDRIQLKLHKDYIMIQLQDDGSVIIEGRRRLLRKIEKAIEMEISDASARQLLAEYNSAEHIA